MPLSANQIKDYRDKVASKGRESAHKFITPLKPFTIVPVLHSILLEGIQRTENKPEMADTYKFFKETVDTIGDLKLRLEKYESYNLVTRLLHLNEILKGLSVEKTDADLKALLANIEKVTVNEEMKDLYNEAAIWLEGWHLHTKSLYKKEALDPASNEPKTDASGVYPIIDGEDRIFRMFTGKSQYLVATHYRDAAKVLRNKLSAYQAENMIAVRHENGRATISVTMESSNELLIARVTNAMKAACQMQATTSFVNEQPAAVLPPAVKKTQEESEKGWRGIFGYVNCSQGKEDVSVDKLMRRFRAYGLTAVQEQALRDELDNLKEAINAQLDSYFNSSYGYFGLGWMHTHAALAEETKQSISTANQPSEIIEILYGLRAQLIRDNSNNLLPKVNELLLEVFDVLRMPFEGEYAQVAGMQLRS